jgi:hypothetical protein
MVIVRVFSKENHHAKNKTFQNASGPRSPANGLSAGWNSTTTADEKARGREASFFAVVRVGIISAR